MNSVKLPDNVKLILKKLNESGYEAFAVGGCVRDSIIGKEPHDWDICTSANPQQILQTFQNSKTILTGLKHGTVTLVLDAKSYEITTYRIDGIYDDARHPQNVSFTTSLYDDLARRDFTINAMAYNEKDGLVDIFNGRNDINDKIIRSVGNAKERFSEDALRIMRALRFACCFGFEIDNKTFAAMTDMRGLLLKVSKERINSELTRMLMGNAKTVSNLILKANQIFVQLFPILKMTDDSYIANISHADPIKNVRIALLFDVSEDKLRKNLTELRYDRKTIVSILNIEKYGRIILKDEQSRHEMEYFVKSTMHNIGYEDTQMAIFYAIAHARAESNKQDEIRFINMLYIALSVKNKGLCHSLSQLALSGNDIKQFGYDGQEIGNILNYLLDNVMRGNFLNDRDNLMEQVEKLGEM